MATAGYDQSVLDVHERMLTKLRIGAYQDADKAGGNYAPVTFDSSKLISHKETYSAPFEGGLEPAIIFTTQPQCGSRTEEVDGQTEFVLQYPKMKQAILNTPGFPQSVPVPPSPKSYAIVKIPSKGLGMVAIRDIPYGELIVAERAMLIAVRGAAVEGSSSGPTEAMYQASLVGVERYLEVAIERMETNPKSKKNVALIKNLCNSHLHDGSGPLAGILRTNCFGVPLPLDKDSSHGALFNKLSRLNHSCSPNTYRNWNTASLSMQIHAVRDIKKGEEITTWYALPLEPVSERRPHLIKYGIDCHCRACTHPASERNRVLLAEFERTRFNMDLIIQTARTSPTRLRDGHLKPVLKMLKLIEEEGAEATEAYSMVLHRLAMIYYALGDTGKAKTYHQKWRIWQRACATEEDSAVLVACLYILVISKVVPVRL